ncbi:VWA domain-containing protein, partial [Porticoccaceae bacterium]|nr:VWA domain-containing protein [Porticoccaceae bacterium]
SLVLEQVVEGIRQYSPGNGTSLINALNSINDFEDQPDNMFILTDGLPTQGAAPPKKYMVSGQQRRSFFAKALESLPGGMPVNTILFPMEGDPEAAALFWQLGVNTQGAFIAPSRDWP